MLMDLFYKTLPPSITRKRRIHFHAFMIDVHKRVHGNKVSMGPEGGEEGGMVVATGTPEEVAGTPGSHTGQFLAELVSPAEPKVRRKRPARAKAAA